MTVEADLLLSGGTTIDAETGERLPITVAVADGTIAGIGEETLDARAARTIDCRGAIVSAGLVDLHSHVHDGVFDVAVPPDDGHLRRGVVLVNDAGSVGLSGFRGFRSYTAERALVDITCYLNVSSVGLVNIHVSEFADPHAVLVQQAADLIAANRDLIRGVKVRLSRSETGEKPLEALAQALDLGERASVPVMAHVGATACTFGDILRELRPGDIVTHCFHGKGEGIVRDGKVIDEAWDARRRGVLFDVGHGTTQMSYEVARTALAAGFPPDTISSDLSRRNWMAPAYDLATVISKLVALGMPLASALHAATAVPAGILGADAEGYGTLRVGGVAAVTVLEERDIVDVLPDARNDRLQVRRLEPVAVVHHGRLVETVPWRGMDVAA